MQKLKTQMVNEFGSIFDLCKSVLSANVPESLSKAAFETLLKFISWIPIQFVFQQSLIDILTRKVCYYHYTNGMYSCIFLSLLNQPFSETSPYNALMKLQISTSQVTHNATM
jgi:hypothetical protein